MCNKFHAIEKGVGIEEKNTNMQMAKSSMHFEMEYTFSSSNGWCLVSTLKGGGMEG
jgi:hypothetical protein